MKFGYSKFQKKLFLIFTHVLFSLINQWDHSMKYPPPPKVISLTN